MKDAKWEKECLSYWAARIESVINNINYDSITDKQFKNTIYALSEAYESLSGLKMKLEANEND